MSQQMLQLPSIFREGAHAATVGVHQSSREMPFGFTFCPYRDQSVERWNFLGGCVETYFGGDEPLRGEK